MSKLLNEFEKRKKENPEKLFLFKSGIFYVSLNEDATKMANLFDFKITNLNETTQKCGFPEKRLEFYTKLLTTCAVDFEIVDLNYGKIENHHDYLKDKKAREILTSIQNLDMNQISFQEAFHLLNNFHEKLKNLDLDKETN